MECKLEMEVEKSLVEKLLDYTSSKDFDDRDCNVLEIIRLVQETAWNKEEQLCELQTLMMMFDVLQTTCIKNKLNFNDIVNNEFTHVTG